MCALGTNVENNRLEFAGHESRLRRGMPEKLRVRGEGESPGKSDFSV